MSMSMVHPSVHPIEAPPMTDHAIAIPRHTLKDTQGMPGTLGGFLLRFLQFSFAVVSLSVMATTSDFPSVTAFRYLVAAVSLQSLWSLSLAVADIYAILVRRGYRNIKVVRLFSIGDGGEASFQGNKNITSTLTFSAACASAGITVLIGNDLNDCAQNHCSRFETATAMAFMSWFAASPSFILNFWSLASK
ncbi:CASP-like protein 5A2 isoform X1 [Vigna umbellata]|uniref:CASP-like protein n=1 Tax=Vigna radiata var. radiata TaxID=3916 RepID=A0A3Q0FEU8_VIGRR|nr:CASP-like protein 5A2 isoform X1 [Vigna radiata var. radiata]XP_047176124.1 CASP-like protein 5A2 isoform X1 [Vigna umbellata]